MKVSQHFPPDWVHRDRTASTENAADFPHVGDILLRRYAIVGVRQGGFGVVFFVTDLETNQDYAAKTIKPRHLGRKSRLELFKSEVDLWLHLRPQPNIVRAHFVELINNRPYLFMEYVDGGAKTSLRDWLTPTPQLDFDRVLDWAVQLCTGMELVSRGGEIAHCDLKPENVLVTKENVVKVTDFGAAQKVRVKEGAYAKAELFTPLYSSPEVIARRAVSCKSDIYSFGLILYEMLTGHLPYPFVLSHDRVDQRRQLLDFYEHHGMDEVMRTMQLELPGVDRQRSLKLNGILNGCIDPNVPLRWRNFMELRRQFEEIWKSTAKPANSLEISNADLHLRALSLHRIGRHGEALSMFNRLLQQEPNNGQLWLDAAATLRAVGLEEDAAAFVRMARAKGTNQKPRMRRSGDTANSTKDNG